MTFKVTIWDKEQSIGMVRDYRKPVWNFAAPSYACHGMASMVQNGCRIRPWFIEFEGEVSDEIIYKWAVPALHPHSDSKNITVNGKEIK